MQNIILYGKNGSYQFFPFDSRNVIGEGGMGRVFRGTDQNGNLVAIKAIYAELVKKPSIKDRGEIEAHLRFQHPNLIQMLDYCVSEEGRVHIISKFVDGVSFPQYIKSINGNSIANRNEIFRHTISILEALHFLHQMGIVHRDVKPDNIMITRANEAVLMDLGVARASNGKRLTNAGVVIGTPYYSAPEQIKGENNKISATTDIYATGITLYELLTGNPPFEGSSQFDVMEMQVKKTIPAHSALPLEIYKILKKATQKEQSRRYQTSPEFIEALQNMFERKNWWNRLFS
ncbi:MAG: serine/threonine protein kinase [Saprospiraceae bacterium]|nr:serine/threonine protein kinase [Saprospiraceae bacterium]MDP4913130.1 serine/threonine protein kinase [Saprospiraceae bacterium]